VKSALYTGRVRHRRFGPAVNIFDYSVALFWLDLDEVPRLFKVPFLFWRDAPGLFAFHRKDYLGDGARPLDACVRDLVERKTGRRPAGPIRILTQIRYFGFCFNPVSFYYCFDPSGEKVDFIVSEITNTPWKERHSYVMECRRPHETFSFKKEFHVSPFMPMDVDYRWRFSAPGPTLSVHMENARGGARFFDATMVLARRDWSAAAVALTLLAHPFMTFKTIFLIYWQALILRYKNTPFHPHPTRGETA
jgi:DUF1365 family protein